MSRRRKERRYLQRTEMKRKPSVITRSNVEFLPLVKMWT